MKYVIDGKEYYLPGQMSDFQHRLYPHLADWKKAHQSLEPGFYRGQPNDLVFPDELDTYFHIFPEIREKAAELPFKRHKFFRHMASSQAACLNLFVPMLQFPQLAARILSAVKPDLVSIATEELSSGYELEAWGGQYCENSHGFLNDHNLASGTDADIAIAYRDTNNDLNLWLIEHKLSEQEFTTCGASTSPGRTISHKCVPAAEVFHNPTYCYYSSACNFNYWEMTHDAGELFPPVNFKDDEPCPFMGGLNQLWRNQLLAYAIEISPKTPFKKVYFSVVHHPENHSLAASIEKFKVLINQSDRFFTFNSEQILAQAFTVAPELHDWAAWYRELYFG